MKLLFLVIAVALVACHQAAKEKTKANKMEIVSQNAVKAGADIPYNK